jgi:uncharacterized membrane protein YhaH (DUF805 family)
MTFGAAISYNLKNLVNFNGRQARDSFWPYAGVVLALAFLGVMLAMVPEILSTFGRIDTFIAENPELATVDQSAGQYSVHIEGSHPELFPNVTMIVAAMSVVIAVTVALLAAAVTRRLHDRGMSGLWGMAPAILLFSGLAIFATLFGQMMSDDGFTNPALFLLGFANNLLYLASLIFLLVQLAGSSTTRPTRFGTANGDL